MFATFYLIFTPERKFLSFNQANNVVSRMFSFVYIILLHFIAKVIKRILVLQLNTRMFLCACRSAELSEVKLGLITMLNKTFDFCVKLAVHFKFYC
jgi:hypothetical protein